MYVRSMCSLCVAWGTVNVNHSQEHIFLGNYYLINADKKIMLKVTVVDSELENNNLISEIQTFEWRRKKPYNHN